MSEQEKKYRPFNSAEEFAPHRDRWVSRSSSSYPDEIGYLKISAYDDQGVWINGSRYRYFELFSSCRKFEDGSPFGVKVVDPPEPEYIEPGVDRIGCEIEVSDDNVNWCKRTLSAVLSTNWIENYRFACFAPDAGNGTSVLWKYARIRKVATS